MKKTTKKVNSELDVIIQEEIKDEEIEAKAEAICPSCGVKVFDHKCRLCGATKNISQVSGNVIWMRNGRVVAAFDDVKQAFVKMAIKYGIPISEYPEQFKKDGK